MIITNKNYIYTYFHIMKELQPLSVLDIGMFLKRVGSVSRQMMNCEIPWDIRLDGIDFFPELQFPAWETIYDEIYTETSFIAKDGILPYELGIFLGSEAPMLNNKNLQKKLLIQLSHKVSWLLTDTFLRETAEEFSGKKMQPVTVDGNTCYLIEF